MARTDLQTDATINALIASYEERIELARINQITLAVEMAADQPNAANYAQQILAHQRDVDVLTAAASELDKIAGKPNSGRKVTTTAAAAVAAAGAVPPPA